MRPAVLQKLQSGLALSGVNFPAFVDTWNWMVDFINNIKGDADISPSSGSVSVDKHNPDFPVIRFHKGTGDDGGEGDTTPKMFEPTFNANGTLASVGSGFIPFGRSFYWMKAPSFIASSATTGLVVLRIKHPTESTQLSCEVRVQSGYSTSSANGYLTTSGYDTSDIPLYFFVDGAITMDCRHLLSLSVREIG